MFHGCYKMQSSTGATAEMKELEPLLMGQKKSETTPIPPQATLSELQRYVNLAEGNETVALLFAAAPR